MKQFLTTLSAALLFLVAGCATSSVEPAAASGPTATCSVCQHNNDLACVCVKVTGTTPKTEFDGHTYYFCSDDCRAAFLKKPAKYLSQH